LIQHYVPADFRILKCVGKFMIKKGKTLFLALGLYDIDISQGFRTERLAQAHDFIDFFCGTVQKP